MACYEYLSVLAAWFCWGTEEVILIFVVNISIILCLLLTGFIHVFGGQKRQFAHFQQMCGVISRCTKTLPTKHILTINLSNFSSNLPIFCLNWHKLLYNFTMETIKYLVKILIVRSNRINLIPVIVDFTVLYIFLNILVIKFMVK